MPCMGMIHSWCHSCPAWGDMHGGATRALHDPPLPGMIHETKNNGTSCATSITFQFPVPRSLPWPVHCMQCAVVHELPACTRVSADFTPPCFLPRPHAYASVYLLGPRVSVCIYMYPLASPGLPCPRVPLHALRCPPPRYIGARSSLACPGQGTSQTARPCQGHAREERRAGGRAGAELM